MDDAFPLKIEDVNITVIKKLPKPSELIQNRSLNEAMIASICHFRDTVKKILFGEDPRLLVVVGPCSIHDVKAGLEYAIRLKTLAEKVSEKLFIVMRAYFEKPRTSLGWKGLIMDPNLDGSSNIPKGLELAREFLYDLTRLGVPAASELLDPITPQYVADLMAWCAIGARTTESQTHRQMASGLSMPVGFKNTTDGSLQAAINAIKATQSKQTFLGINYEGNACYLTTQGNPYSHLVLRGGKSGPNYSKEAVEKAVRALTENSLNPKLMIDCSHGNSDKDFKKQGEVFQNVISQIKESRSPYIKAVMLESNLKPGNQPFNSKSSLEYGLSVTDGCLGWEETERLILTAADVL